ncbi:ABC transporter substrate-binding protein [Aerococcaceae bacterium DSM 111020]|nr:ABC transporter substrate-binding protein [Aerococcaceae bacterium DSM 111020]
MKMKRFVKSMMVLGALFTSIQPLATQAADTFKLGGNFELSGETASYGTPMSKGVQLAVKETNDNGGVLGQQIEYVEYDNRSDLTEAASVAQRLVNEQVMAIVGPAPSGNVKASIPVINEGGIPAVAPAATLDNITLSEDGEVFDYFFRVSFADSYQGEVAAQYVVDNLEVAKAVIVEDQAVDYSLGLSGAFEDKFTELGGEVVAKQSVQSGETDFSAVLTSLLAQDFDVLYLPIYYTEAGLFIKQAREMGITQPIVGGDGFHSPTLVELAEIQNANDIYFTSHFSTESEDPAVQEFLKNYEEEYGQEADTFAALAYDAANLIFDAAERAGKADPEAIKDAIAATEDFEGVTGTFAIDENHDPVKPALVLKIEDGKIVSSEAVEAE